MLEMYLRQQQQQHQQQESPSSCCREEEECLFKRLQQCQEAEFCVHGQQQQSPSRSAWNATKDSSTAATWKQAARSNRHIRHVKIVLSQNRNSTLAKHEGEGEEVNAPVFTAILSSLSQLPHLQVWKLCGGRRIPLALLTDVLQQAPHLTTLHLTSVQLEVPKKEDMKQFSSHLAQHPFLEEVRLEDVQLLQQQSTSTGAKEEATNALHSSASRRDTTKEDEFQFLDYLFQGLAGTRHFKRLLVAPTNPCALGQFGSPTFSLREFVVRQQDCFESLNLYDMDGFFSSSSSSHHPIKEQTDPSPFQILCQALSSLPSCCWKELYLPFMVTEEHCQAVAQLIQSTTCPRHLTLKCHAPAPPPINIHVKDDEESENEEESVYHHPLLWIAKALQQPPRHPLSSCHHHETHSFPASGLNTLAIVGPEAPSLVPNVLLLQEMVQAPAWNYNLHGIIHKDLLASTSSTDHHWRQRLDYECHLNAWGRAQWLFHQYQNPSMKQRQGKDAARSAIEYDDDSHHELLSIVSHIAQDWQALFCYLSCMNPSVIQHLLVQ
jgi:hypothetical protein